MICFPNAKINIGLNITGKRADGYHDIESIFYPVPVKDALEAVPSEHFRFQSASNELGDDPKDNTVLQAYELLKAYGSLPAVHFYIYKNIPQGSGLGGGSADGAFALKLLNNLLGLGLEELVLYRLSAEIGSDCPFFIENKPKKVTGRGEFLEPVSLDLSGYHYVIVYPGIVLSTKQAYQNIHPQPERIPLDHKVQRPVEEWHRSIGNDFEDHVFKAFPEIKSIKDSLYNSGALFASLTGSGSAVFGIFRDKKALKHQFPESYRVFKGIF